MENAKSVFLRYFNSERIRLLACASSGFLSSLPFFFDRLFLLEWISIIPFFCVLFRDGKHVGRKSFRYGFIFHFVKSVFVLSWFRELLSMSVVDFSPAVMMLAVCAAIVGISALHAVIFGLCAAIGGKISNGKAFTAIRLILCCVVFTCGELLLSFGRFGFPWVVTYITQYRFTFGIQCASLFGGHFVSLLIFLCNTLLAKAFMLRSERKKATAFVGAALILFCANVGYGCAVCTFCESEKSAENIENKLTVAIYQDNHSSYEKWSGNSEDVCREFCDEFEATYTTENSPDIMLLSETVFTRSLKAENCDRPYTVEGMLCSLSKKYNTSIVCGCFSADGEERYNSQMLFENGGLSQSVYRKRTLVPFGEYLPYESTIGRILPFLSELNLSGSSLSFGKGAQLFESEKGAFGGLICYDSVFYQNARESAKNRADLLLLSTNDSWYNASAAITQHFAHAVFRAVENRRPVVRCAATGSSGIISANGRVLCRSKVFERKILSTEISLVKDAPQTHFTRFGYLYLFVAAAAMAAIITSEHFKTKT